VASTPEHLRRRREERRRAARRRRAIAAIALLGAAGAAVAIVILLGGSSGSSGQAGTAAASGAGAGKPSPPPRSSLVRNAHPQPGWRPYKGPVPILEYHVLGNATPANPYPELFVTRPHFRQQMAWLDSHGYEAVTLDQVERAWYGSGTLPPKPVVLSFDDGYRPQFTFALPTLRKHGWAGLLNLKAKGSDLYDSNVEAMIRAGWELAAHTINHLDLTTLDTSALHHEVAGSRFILRRKFKVPVHNFCYPAGRFDATVIGAVKSAGFTGATTEVAGFASRAKPFELDRFEVLGSATTADIGAFLSRNHAQ